MIEKLKVYATSLWKNLPEHNFSFSPYTVEFFWEYIYGYGNVKKSTIDNCDIVCLFIGDATHKSPEYLFDDELSNKIISLNKPIIIFDYSEIEGAGYIDRDDRRLNLYNIWGHKIESEEFLFKGEFNKLHAFLFNNQHLIKSYFKRELSANLDYSHLPFKILPLDYIFYTHVIDENPDTLEMYYERPCIFNFVWGKSNIFRFVLQGEILKNYENFQCEYALSFFQAFNFLKDPTISIRKFLFAVSAEHAERITTGELIDIQRKSMMVIDLYGYGLKCYRNTEGTTNCLTAKQDPTKVIYAYPWIDGDNCIFLPNKPNSNILDAEKSVEVLLKYRHNSRNLLYNMYLNSLKMNMLYNPRNYIPNHIMKNIVENL